MNRILLISLMLSGLTGCSTLNTDINCEARCEGCNAEQVILHCRGTRADEEFHPAKL